MSGARRACATRRAHRCLGAAARGFARRPPTRASSAHAPRSSSATIAPTAKHSGPGDPGAVLDERLGDLDSPMCDEKLAYLLQTEDPDQDAARREPPQTCRRRERVDTTRASIGRSREQLDDAEHKQRASNRKHPRHVRVDVLVLGAPAQR